jgi:hypothetical protein
MKHIISSEDSNRQVIINECLWRSSDDGYCDYKCVIAFCECEVPQLEIIITTACFPDWFTDWIDMFTTYIDYGVTIRFAHWLNRVILNEETKDVLYTLKEVKFNYDLNNSLIERLRDIKYRRLAILTSGKDAKDDEYDEDNEDEEDFEFDED